MYYEFWTFIVELALMWHFPQGSFIKIVILKHIILINIGGKTYSTRTHTPIRRWTFLSFLFRTLFRTLVKILCYKWKSCIENVTSVKISLIRKMYLKYYKYSMEKNVVTVILWCIIPLDYYYSCINIKAGFYCYCWLRWS